MTNPAWRETERRDGIKEHTSSFTQKYRFGFNKQEQETELGEYCSFEYADDCQVLKKPLQCRASTTLYPIVNWVNRRDRVHDARLGRFLSVDPLAPEYPFYSSYQFAANQVVWVIDIEGLEPYIVTHRSFAPWNKFGNFKEKDVFTNNIKTFHVNEIKKGWFLWKKTIDKIYVYNEKSYTIQEWNNMMGYKKAAPDLEQNEGIGGKQCLK